MVRRRHGLSRISAARAAVRRGGLPELSRLSRRWLARRIYPVAPPRRRLPPANKRRSPAATVPSTTGVSSVAAKPSILDDYITGVPDAARAVNVFVGEWASRLPEPHETLTGGTAPLFEDERVVWALSRLGDLTGRRVLELGPLEAGHTYMLTRAGAEVFAIEAQQRAYLKCLIVKELLEMRGARFGLGDFQDYLRMTSERFDVCFASGVLYHMRNPVETIELSAKIADKLFLWTHYYDEAIITSRPDRLRHFPSRETVEHAGFPHTLHRFNYDEALSFKGFCGGGASHSNWLSRGELMSALRHFGWRVEDIAFETPDHPSGPALALVAANNGAR